MNLVWNNCMTYNVEGSPYYLVAAKLKQIFEERYAKVVRDEGAYAHSWGGGCMWQQRRCCVRAHKETRPSPSPHPPLPSARSSQTRLSRRRGCRR